MKKRGPKKGSHWVKGGKWVDMLRYAKAEQVFWIEHETERLVEQITVIAKQWGMEVEVQRWTAMQLRNRVKDVIPVQRLLRVEIIRERGHHDDQG